MLTWETDDAMMPGELETYNDFFTIFDDEGKYHLVLIDGGHEIGVGDTIAACQEQAEVYFKRHFNKKKDELVIPEAHRYTT